MMVDGKLDEFQPTRESWKAYIERQSFSCEVNQITDENQKRAILLSVVGAEVHQVM